MRTAVAVFNAVVSGGLVNIVVADTPGDPTPTPVDHDTTAGVDLGAPDVEATAEAVQAAAPVDHDTTAGVDLGAPDVEATAEAVPAAAPVDHDTTAGVDLGAPDVEATAEAVQAAAPVDVGATVDAGAPGVSATAEIVGPGATVHVQIASFLAALWMPRPNPPRAIMPISITVERDAEHLVPALCRELSRVIEWCVFGETCIPSDAGPQGVIPRGAAETVYGGLVVSTDPNQAAPEYEESDPEPSVSECRLLLTQPVTANHDDLELLLDRRAELRRVICRLNGEIGS